MMDATAVRAVVETMRRETKSRAARIAMAKAALKLAKLTPCGRAVWQEFLEENER